MSYQNIRHNIQLFLNPHNRLPYLLYTHTVDENTIRRRVFTITLPCQTYLSGRSQRQLIMRTESHTPNRITTLTFPATSVTHQLSIMTLLAHLLLHVPNITARQSLNIVRDSATHYHTMQLILATVTLKRYHKVWSSLQSQPLSLPKTLPLHQPSSHKQTLDLPPRL